MKERNLGIDLLRIVAMFMIVMLHVLGQGGILYEVKEFTSQYYVCWFLELSVVAAVNIYAIISGYVGYEAKCRLSRLFNLWFQVVFYTIILGAYFMYRYPQDFLTKTNIVKALLPITTIEYWYISSYFGMFFLMPVMNIAIEKLEEKQLRFSLIGLLVLYTFLPTMLNQDPFSLNEGYSVLWLCVLYLIGGYLKKYQIADKVSHRMAGLTWLFCVVGVWAFKIALEFATLHVFGTVKYSYILVYYTMPVTVIEAIALVLFFSKVKVEKKAAVILVKTVSAATLGVYIIHKQTFVYYKVIYQMTSYLAKEAPWKILGMVLLDAVMVFTVCAVIDIARKKLFQVIGIPKLSGWLERKIMREKKQDSQKIT